ncbi:UDP-N-acetylmuramate--L-alanine ligase [Fontisphaera persica]|uniref:UDP-N-acetylmuramate--L-alanine ligase n=1 Tax=Fontisphaera persica TaxID=2974023 RepID=UPI0024BFCFCA|nr:UDP-N-acetylmuramate--L-alanine ligase [Fontisphaera persica]WCJ58009.1 UDP-N-acetylmuramate--L-alanine ligase [Fontisphaera persica]
MNRYELDTWGVEELLRRAGSSLAVHLIGAGGCGMSGLGHLLLDLGCRVTGSDLQDNAETAGLRARGAMVHQGHAASHITAAAPHLVVRSSAVPEDNPEWRQAREAGIPLARRAPVLAALAHRQRPLCVAGMHGKTTTTAWLAFALEQLGASPSYAVGWLTPQLSPHARYSHGQANGQPPWFVLEADESDGTLLEFRPHAAILLNVDEDHLDYFQDFAAVRLEFQQFADQVRGGPLLYCLDDERLAGLMKRRPDALAYGCHPLAHYRLEFIHCRPQPGPSGAAPEPASCFEIWHQRRRLGEFHTRLLGAQNLSNAAAVIAMLHQLGYAVDDIARAVAGFSGAARRQQCLYRDAHVAVYDDYGHHPNEIRLTLQAMRSLSPQRLLVAFQPHRYTRTQKLVEQFATCFKGADRLWLLPIYPASEPPIPGVDSEWLAQAIRTEGQPVELCEQPAALAQAVRAQLQPGDLALFIGAGADITVAAHLLASQLRADNPLPASPGAAAGAGGAPPAGRCCGRFR